MSKPNMMGKSASDSIRVVMAQAGSSLSLICFLFFVRVVMFNILSQNHSNQMSLHNQQTEDSYINFPSFTAARDNFPRFSAKNINQILDGDDDEDTQDLKESLRILELDSQCAKLLECINYGVEAPLRHLDNAQDISWCKESYSKCKSRGLLHHFNKIVKAVREI